RTSRYRQCQAARGRSAQSRWSSARTAVPRWCRARARTELCAALVAIRRRVGPRAARRDAVTRRDVVAGDTVTDNSDTASGAVRGARRVGWGILVSRFAGLARGLLIARYFGDGAAADAYNAALRIPN